MRRGFIIDPLNSQPQERAQQQSTKREIRGVVTGSDFDYLVLSLFKRRPRKANNKARHYLRPRGALKR